MLPFAHGSSLIWVWFSELFITVPSTDEMFKLLSSGTLRLPYPSPHVYPSTTMVSPTWSGVVNNDADASTHFSLQQEMHMLGKQNLCFGSSLSSSYKLGWKQFPFLEVDKPPTFNRQTTSSPPRPSHEAFICQPLLRNIPLSESGGAGSYSIFCDRLTTTTQVQDSDCALSLLSSTQTQTSENHMILQPNSIPLVLPMDPMDSVLVSNHRDEDSPWSSGSKSSQTLPFNWE